MKTPRDLLRFLPALALAAAFPVAACAAAPTPPAAVRSAKAAGVELLAGKRVMILGDSITQQGTWVSFLDYFLQKRFPAKTFDIINLGLASETTSGLTEPGHAGGAFPRPCLHDRLDRALKAVKPRVVIACYGMNDGIYKPYDEERMKAFRLGVTKLAAACAAARAKLVLVTPPVFEGGGDYDGVLAKFAAWEVATPPAGVTVTVDLHTAMRAELESRRAENPGFKFTGDGIHPGDLGHLVMALSVMKGLGIEAPAEPAEKLMPEIKADPLWAPVNKRRAVRAEGWMNHVGYSREKTVAPGTGDIAAVEREADALREKIEQLRRAAR